MKTIDGVIIACLTIAVLIGSAFIFIGSEDDLLILKQDLYSSIVKRSMVFGLSGGIALFLIRFLIFQLIGDKDSNPSNKRLIIGSLLYCLLAAFLGSLYFFFKT